MADPVSMLAGGTALQVISSIQQGKAQAASLQSQQNAANYNAQLYQQQAEQTMAQAAINSNLQAKNMREALGQQRAGIAESGIGFNGTGGDLIDQSSINAELDRQNTLYGGILNAQSLNSQAQQSYYQAEVAGNQISSANNSGYIGATANILSGYGQYKGYQNKLNNPRYGMYGTQGSGF